MKTDYSRKLRHIQPEGAAFFVTWHLEGAVPHSELLRIRQERDKAIQLLRKMNPPNLSEQIYLKQREAFFRYEAILDSGRHGPHFLKDPNAAFPLMKELHRYDGLFYQLEGFTIMSNHVHALFDFSIQMAQPGYDSKNYVQLDTVLKKIKGASARFINLAIRRTGKLWAEESWDRYIRNEKHFHAAIDYMASNPVKARLCRRWSEYPFTWIRDKNDWNK